MLRFTDLALRQGSQLLVDAANFEIFERQKVGLAGANGSGKSSLLALILGELEADHGEVTVPADWVIAHVAQAVPASESSAQQYVLGGDASWTQLSEKIALATREDDGEGLARLHQQLEEIDGYAAPSRASALLSGLGFSDAQMQQSVNQLSGGWKMRLNLARALISRSDLLLLDEPTNHLDFDAILWLQAWLERYPGTLVVISHDREFLDAVVKTVLFIENRTISSYQGNYSAFEQQRAARLALQGAAYVKQQNQIAQMQSFVDRFKAKATKAKQAQSRVKALQRMQLIAPAQSDSAFEFNFVPADKTPDSLLKIVDADVGYGQSPVLRDVNLGLVNGDRIGLIGVNGAGKSTLIKLIEATLSPQQGSVTRSKHLQVGYFAQHQLDRFDSDSSPFEYLSAQQPDYSEQDVYNHLGGFGFKKASTLATVRHFSGGEKARLALALLVAQRPNLLLLDEPTNHLDLQMRHALSVALQAFEGALVLVSHDRFLLRSTADKLVLVDDGHVSEYAGDLDDYRRHIQAGLWRDSDKATGVGAEAITPANKKAQRQQRAKQREQLKPLMQAVSKLEKALAALSQQQKDIENTLTDESLYAPENNRRLGELLKDQAKVNREHEDIETEWLAKALQLEEALVDP